MNCKDFQTLTPLYHSGELDRSLAELFDSHGRTCAACAREFDAQKELDAALLRSILIQRAESAAIEEYVRKKIAAEAAAETTEALDRVSSSESIRRFCSGTLR